MHPVKVYDKHGKLLRTISSKALNIRSDKILNSKRPRGSRWRIAKVQKAMKYKDASQTNNDLFVPLEKNINMGEKL